MAYRGRRTSIDPRILILFSFIYTIYIFLEQMGLNLAILTFIFLILLLIRHQKLIKNIILLFIITGLMIVFFLHILFQMDPTVLMVIYFRITSISGLYTLFYAEINPENLTKALIYFKLPYQYAWTISTSFRYIFFLVQESQEVRNALLLRGIPLDGNIYYKIKSLPIITSQLLFRTNFIALKFSEALFAKSWSPYGKKTWFHPLNIYDSIYINVLILTLIFIIVLKLFLNIGL